MKKPTSSYGNKLTKNTMPITKGPGGFMAAKNTRTWMKPGKGGMKASGGTISPAPALLSVKGEVGSSADVYNEAGSGSRPRKSNFPIQSSAPADPHMIRPAPSPLK